MTETPRVPELWWSDESREVWWRPDPTSVSCGILTLADEGTPFEALPADAVKLVPSAEGLHAGILGALEDYFGPRPVTDQDKLAQIRDVLAEKYLSIGQVHRIRNIVEEAK